jgi:Tol biopolymer transport system component
MLAGFGLAAAWLWYNNTRPVAVPTRVAEATATLARPSATAVPNSNVVPTVAPTFTAPPPTNTQPPPTAVPTTPTTVSATNNQIAFVSERLGAPQIFLMNADGTNQRPLTNQAGGACQPVWAPDGTQLLFISPCARKAVTYREAALYRINADGSEVALLLQLEGGVFDVSWSQSGLAFVSFVSTRPQIFYADADGQNVTRLSVPSASDRQPTWSPEGQRIVFLNVSRVPGQSILYWMNRDGSYEGSSPLQVTRDLDAIQPAWSPDARLIAFVSDGLLYTVEWDKLGFGAQRLTSVRPNEEPSWAPDGQALAFESLRDDPFGSDIYRIGLSGEPATRLTTDPAKDYQPAWQP